MKTLANLPTEIVKGICYSVEHMSVMQWCIVGTISVVLGFLCLKSNR